MSKKMKVLFYRNGEDNLLSKTLREILDRVEVEDVTTIEFREQDVDYVDVPYADSVTVYSGGDGFYVEFDNAAAKEIALTLLTGHGRHDPDAPNMSVIRYAAAMAAWEIAQNYVDAVEEEGVPGFTSDMSHADYVKDFLRFAREGGHD